MKQSKWLLAATAVASAAVVAGCAQGNQASSTNQSSTNQSYSTKVAGTSYPLTVTDQAGQKVTVKKQPHHIASVTEGTDEILSALVPKKDIAMVTSLASDPVQSNIASFVKGIPSIGTANAEAIIAVHPDLALLASYTKAGVVKQIQQAGIPTYEFANFNSIKDIEGNITSLGQLVGQPSQAKKLVSTLNAQLQAVKSAVKGQKKLTVLNYSSYHVVAGTGTTVDDIIVASGGINAAAKFKGWQSVTDEQVVKLNPDVIIVSSDDQGFAKKLLGDPKYQTVNAIAHKHVFEVRPADLMSTSQYIINGVKDVAHDLYPNVKLPK